jgi:hypothetical protein
LRTLRFPIATVLVGLGLLGAFREHHASTLVEPLMHNLPPLDTVAGIREMNVRVAGRFAEADLGRPPVESNWALHTAAHYLVEGGSCGPASMAMGTLLSRAGRPFRILLINVTASGATHVMVEAQLPDGRWLLVDPLVGVLFGNAAGEPRTIEEIRAQEYRMDLLEPKYQQGGEWDLFARYQRTNWERAGPLAPLFQALLPRDFSMGAFMIVLAEELSGICTFLFLLLFAVTSQPGWWSRLLRRA